MHKYVTDPQNSNNSAKKHWSFLHETTEAHDLAKFFFAVLISIVSLFLKTAIKSEGNEKVSKN